MDEVLSLCKTIVESNVKMCGKRLKEPYQ